MLHFSKFKAFAVAAVVVFAALCAFPNLLDEKTRESLPGFLPNQALTLGLDLQGGSHVLLEVDAQSLKEGLSKQLVGDIRLKLRDGKIRYQGLRQTPEGAVVTITDAADAELGETLLRELSQPVDVGMFGQGGQVQEFDISRTGQTIRMTFSQGGLDSRIGRAVQQSLEIIGRRINALGTTEPTIQRQGVDRIVVQVPGLQDPTRLKALLGQTAKLSFQLLCDQQPQGPNETVPLGCEQMPERNNADILYWVQTSRSATVDGEDLNDAQTGFDQRTNEPVVNFRFNTGGAQRFCRLTQANVGRPFAIVLDAKVVSAPRINEQICGGSGQISGNFTTEEANNLAIVLRSGALPAKLTIVEERTVGPSLGSDSVSAGTIASMIGFAGVLIFMFVSYGLFGLFAVVALAGQPADRAGFAFGAGRNADAAWHCRYRADHGYGGGLQRAGVRAHQGRGGQWAISAQCHRDRLPHGARHHSRCQHHHAYCCGHPVRHGLRSGARLCCDPGYRHPVHGVYRLHGNPPDHRLLGAHAPPQVGSALRPA
jgi:protein-export membrane protein SecD